RTGWRRPLRIVEGWRKTLWRCQLGWRPLRRRCLSLSWLSPWLVGTVPLVALRARLLVAMVACLLSVLPGPSLVREGRARSVGSIMTFLTRGRLSRSLMPARPPLGGWLAEVESLLWDRRAGGRINLRGLQLFGVV